MRAIKQLKYEFNELLKQYRGEIKESSEHGSCILMQQQQRLDISSLVY